MSRSFAGQYNGYGYRVTLLEATTPPKPFVEVWCWKCLSYVTPTIHSWAVCYRIRKISRRLGKILPPVTLQEQQFHSTEIARVYCAVLVRIAGRTPNTICTAPYPIQIAEVSSTKGNSREGNPDN